MIWLTWRQFRAQAWTMSAFLAVVAVVLVVTGVGLAHLYDANLAGCSANGDCGTAAGDFLAAAGNDFADTVVFRGSIVIVYVLPAVIGLFWGAPLITREIETGTYRLAWNQSVTRTRWLAVKLGAIGVVAMAASGLLSLAVSWWAVPIDHAAALAHTRNGSAQVSRLSPVMFGAHGIAPVGYAAFAFALGAAAGVLIRRTVPAMAVTLAVFAAVQIVWPIFIRPHLIAPVTVNHPLNPALIDGVMSAASGRDARVFSGVDLPGAWVVSNNVDWASGRLFTGPLPPACGKGYGSFQACGSALGRLHLRQVVSYEPDSRYWAFQWYETAIFVVLALALAGLCFWQVRRRRIA